VIIVSDLIIIIGITIRDFTLTSINENTKNKRGTLGVVCCKRFLFDERGYSTNGAFMEYVESMVPYFEKIDLCVPVTRDSFGEGTSVVDQSVFNVIEIPYYKNFIIFMIKMPLIYWKIKRNMHRWDVINPRYPDLVGVLAAIQAKKKGIPSFHTIVDDWKEESELGGGRGPLVNFFLTPVARLFFMYYLYLEKKAVNNSLVFCHGLSIVDRLKGDSPHIHGIIATSIDENEIIFEEKALPEKKIKFLAVGRLAFEKGHDLLLSALANFNNKNPKLEWEARIVGWGNYKSRLEKQAQKLGIGKKVTLTGGVPRGEKLLEHYDWADVFVHPSRSEGTPKVILEAMARGLPVIATEVGGVSKMVDDKVTGILVPSEDLEKLTSAIMLISKDAKLFQKLRNNGHEFVLGRTKSAYAEKVIFEFDKQNKK
jgi:glycosyltransferase involved in cell wall biosynthesis